jgi:hypothetical protein
MNGRLVFVNGWIWVLLFRSLSKRCTLKAKPAGVSFPGLSEHVLAPLVDKATNSVYRVLSILPTYVVL